MKSEFWSPKLTISEKRHILFAGLDKVQEELL